MTVDEDEVIDVKFRRKDTVESVEDRQGDEEAEADVVVPCPACEDEPRRGCPICAGDGTVPEEIAPTMESEDL